MKEREVTQHAIDRVKKAIQLEINKTEKYFETLEMYRDILEKKDFKYMNMSDEERLNGAIAKRSF